MPDMLFLDADVNDYGDGPKEKVNFMICKLYIFMK